jgi:hypothetical protein
MKPIVLGILLVQAVVAQPTNNVLTRISMVESQFGRGTVFSLDVDQREYWITAKHILTGAEHPPYGSFKGKSTRLKILNPVLQGEQWLTIDFSVLVRRDCHTRNVGTNEPARMKQSIEKLHTSLDESKIQHVFYESPGTDHEWQTWRRDLNDFAPRLFQEPPVARRN